METLYKAGIFILLCFGVGSLPFGYWIPKLFRGVDIRNFGSRNIGSTNVFRVMGWKGGVAVLLFDLTKGFLPTLVARSLWGLHLSLLAGLASIGGHIFTPFLGFKGGKGVATGFGSFLAIAPFAVSLSFGVWLLLFFLFRYVSFASLMASLFLPLFLLVGKGLHLGEYSHEVFILSLVVMGTIFLRHRSNIQKLLRGEENKFNLNPPQAAQNAK